MLGSGAAGFLCWLYRSRCRHVRRAHAGLHHGHCLHADPLGRDVYRAAGSLLAPLLRMTGNRVGQIEFPRSRIVAAATGVGGICSRSASGRHRDRGGDEPAASADVLTLIARRKQMPDPIHMGGAAPCSTASAARSNSRRSADGRIGDELDIKYVWNVMDSAIALIHSVAGLDRRRWRTNRRIIRRRRGAESASSTCRFCSELPRRRARRARLGGNDAQRATRELPHSRLVRDQVYLQPRARAAGARGPDWAQRFSACCRAKCRRAAGAQYHAHGTY